MKKILKFQLITKCKVDPFFWHLDVLSGRKNAGNTSNVRRSVSDSGVPIDHVCTRPSYFKFKDTHQPVCFEFRWSSYHNHRLSVSLFLCVPRAVFLILTVHRLMMTGLVRAN